MNSRMEKYNEESFMSRTQKNENLYSSLDMSDLSRIKTNNNISIISDAQKQIDIEKIKRYLQNEEEKEEQKRLKLDLPEKQEQVIERKEEKDYDIISVLQRAKSTRNIDEYENTRHRKINNCGYEILDKLKIDNKSPEEEIEHEELNTEEKTIIDLIHTIAINSNKSKEEDDLFSDLMSGNEDTKVLPIILEHEKKPSLTEELKNISAIENIEFNKIKSEKPKEEDDEIETLPKIEKIKPEKNEKSMPGIDKSFFTNSLTFSKDDFEGFEELEKKVNKSSTFTKIAVIIIILLLLATTIVVLNYILELNWF